MCDKVVNTYPSTIKFVLKCINFIPDKYKTQEICGVAVFNDPLS